MKVKNPKRKMLQQSPLVLYVNGIYEERRSILIYSLDSLNENSKKSSRRDLGEFEGFIGYDKRTKKTYFFSKKLVEDTVVDLVSEKALEKIAAHLKREGYQAEVVDRLGLGYFLELEGAFEQKDLPDLRKTLREFKPNGSSTNRSTAEKFLQRAGISDSVLEDRLNEITEKSDKLLEETEQLIELPQGYGSIYVVYIGNGDVAKINTLRRHKRETLVYKLLQGTETGKSIPMYKDECHSDEVGFIRIGLYKRYPDSFLRLIKNRTAENRQAYIKENLRAMAHFHTDLTARAKQTGDYDKFEHDLERHHSGKNHDISEILNPRGNKYDSRFKRSLPSRYDLANADDIADECKAIIAQYGKSLIHGDWKPENGLVYDFAGSRKGLELEDIMRFLTNYLIEATPEEAKQYTEEYIKIRSSVDEEFSKDTELKNVLRKCTGLFYNYAHSEYAVKANSRRLIIPEFNLQRLHYNNTLDYHPTIHIN